MPQSYLFFTAKTIANRPILVETLLPSSQNHCYVIPCFVLMLLPWKQRGSTKLAWGWVSSRVHHTSACHWHSWARLHWHHELSAGLSPFLCPCTLCCVPLFVKRKIQPNVPISYSDFTLPSDLPLIFLAAWQALSCCAWVSYLTIPASPTLTPWERRGHAGWWLRQPWVTSMSSHPGKVRDRNMGSWCWGYRLALLDQISLSNK